MATPKGTIQANLPDALSIEAMLSFARQIGYNGEDAVFLFLPIMQTLDQILIDHYLNRHA